MLLKNKLNIKNKKNKIMARKKKTTEEAPQVDNNTESKSITDEGTVSNVQTVEEIKQKSNTAIPPIQLRRNEYGLLESVDYKYRSDGSVDWRAMVSKEFLYPNKDKTKQTDISKLKDNELVIMLGGLKELARIRGYKSIEFVTNNPNSSFASTTCKITWIPNYETENREIVSSDGSCAHIENVNDFMAPYLTECSINRSFARCIRSFLNINIVSHEELFDKSKLAHVEKQGGENSPHATLENCMADHGLTFEKLKTKCINAESYKFKNPEQWNSLKDIPKKDVFYIMGILNKK